jgi:SAM-dependent methyltransferase
MSEDDERLVAIGRGLAQLLVDHGLTETSAVIDVGSGYGRLTLGIFELLRYRGRYLGFDILPRHVEWCARHLTRIAPNVRFRHLDVRNERYNPGGRIDPAAMRFPAGSASFDVAAVFSVFTHLDRGSCGRYLVELARVLRPGGVAVTTWFAFDDDRLPAMGSEQASYRMEHVLEVGVRTSFPDNPLRAIAFEESLVRRMVADAGLEVESVARGTWAGEPGRTFQDVFVLRRDSRPTPLSDRLRDVVGRLAGTRDAARSGIGRIERRVRRRLRPRGDATARRGGGSG